MFLLSFCSIIIDPFIHLAFLGLDLGFHEFVHSFPPFTILNLFSESTCHTSCLLLPPCSFLSSDKALRTETFRAQPRQTYIVKRLIEEKIDPRANMTLLHYVMKSTYHAMFNLSPFGFCCGVLAGGGGGGEISGEEKVFELCEFCVRLDRLSFGGGAGLVIHLLRYTMERSLSLHSRLEN